MMSERWGFTPEQVAGLTNWQIEFCYVRPAVEETARLRKQMADEQARGGSPGTFPSDQPLSAPMWPPLDELIDMAAKLGMSREQFLAGNRVVSEGK